MKVLKASLLALMFAAIFTYDLVPVTDLETAQTNFHATKKRNAQ